MTYFKITPEILSEWRDKAELDKSLIYNLVKNHVIKSEDYLNWASQEYKMPIVNDSVCSLLSSLIPEKGQLPELFWREDYVPLARWKDYTIVGCIEPLAVEPGVIQILASPHVLHEAWSAFNGVSSNVTESEELKLHNHAGSLSLGSIPETNLSLNSDQLPPLPLEAEAFSAPLTGLDVSAPGSPPELGALPPIPLDEIVSPERSQEIFKQLEAYESPSFEVASQTVEDRSSDFSHMSEESHSHSEAHSESDPHSESESDPHSDNESESSEHSDSENSEECENADESHAEPMGEPIGLSAEVSSPSLDFSTIFSLDALNSKMAETSVQFPPTPAAEVTLNQPSLYQSPSPTAFDLSPSTLAAQPLDQNPSVPSPASQTIQPNVRSVFDQSPTTELSSSHLGEQEAPSPLTAEAVLQRTIHVTKAWSLEELTKIGNVNKIDGALMKTLDVTAIFDDAHSRSRGLTREEMIEAYDDIEVCKDIDQMLAAAFKLMHQHFKHSMFLGFFQNQLLPIRWSSQWPMEQNQMPSPVDIASPSPFKIAYSTGLPYHGYTIPNPITDQFFKFWNRGERPDHLTLHPVKIAGKTFGYLMGVQASDLINTRYSLRFIEDLVSRIEKRLNELGVRERAAA